jgi:hypothetical protein
MSIAEDQPTPLETTNQAQTITTTLWRDKTISRLQITWTRLKLYFKVAEVEDNIKELSRDNLVQKWEEMIPYLQINLEEMLTDQIITEDLALAVTCKINRSIKSNRCTTLAINSSNNTWARTQLRPKHLTLILRLSPKILLKLMRNSCNSSYNNQTRQIQTIWRYQDLKNTRSTSTMSLLLKTQRVNSLKFRSLNQSLLIKALKSSKFQIAHRSWRKSWIKHKNWPWQMVHQSRTLIALDNNK